MLSDAETETKWQISVIPAMNKTIILTVPQNCTTEKLYEEVKKHPLSPVAVQHVLMSTEGELENSCDKYLSDYDIENRSTIQLTAKVIGGLWPSDEYLDTKPIKTEDLEMTTSDDHPDVFGFDNDTPRAIMVCGHAVAPLSLALHCYDELKNGKAWIQCPDPDCCTGWKFSQIREAASLTVDQGHELERKALFNRMQYWVEEMKSCPKCGTFCSRPDHRCKLIVCSNCTVRSGKLFEFCWTCLTPRAHNDSPRCETPECWSNQSLFDILAICAMTEINGVECPSKRACPKCYTVIESVKVCKDRTCDFCKYEFCFICLKPYPCKTDVWGTCDVAPRQTLTQIRPIAKGEARWQITVISFNGDHIEMNVPADCFVDEFIRMLYHHPMAPKCCGYRVIFNNVRLDNRGKKRLSEYGVQDHSCLYFFISLLGG